MTAEGYRTMPTDLPPPTAPEDFNPYAPPSTAIDEELIDLVPMGDLAAAEAIRRAHIGPEASVKSIGSLHFLGALFGYLGAGALMLTALTRPVADFSGPTAVML